MKEPLHPRRRVWRWLVAFLLLVILGLGAALMLCSAWLLHPDRLRTTLTELIEVRTGLNLSVEQVDARLFPHPSLVLNTITLEGSPGTMLAQRIAGRLSWRPLLRGHIHVSEVLVEKPEFLLASVAALRDFPQTLPKQDGAGRWAALPWEVHSVQVDGLRLHVGDRELLGGSATIQDASAADLTLDLDLKAPAFGPEATVQGRLTFPREGDSRRLTGSLLGTQFGLPGALLCDGMAPMISLEATALDSPLHAPGVTLSGRAKLGSDEAAFHATVWWEAGRFSINDFSVTGAELAMEADASFGANLPAAIQVSSLHIGGPTLSLLLQCLPSSAFQFDAVEDAVLQAEDVLLGWQDQQPRLVSGRLACAGFTMHWATHDTRLNDLSATLELEENVIRLTSLKTAGVELHATAGLDFSKRLVDFEAGGAADLESLYGHWESKTVHSLGGKVRLNTLSGSWNWQTRVLPEIRAEAEFEQVKISVQVPNRETPLKLSGLGGGIAYAGNRLALRSISGEGIELDGEVLRLPAGGYLVALHGEADLASGLAGRWLPEERVKDLRGRLVFSDLSGTFSEPGQLPPDLRLSGSLENGAATVKIAQKFRQFEQVQATFATSGENIAVQATGNSPSFGPAIVDATLVPEERLLRGTVEASAEQVIQSLMSDGQGAAWAAALASGLGSDRYEAELLLPRPEAQRVRFRAQRIGGDLDVQLQGEKQADGWLLTAFQVRGSAPSVGLYRMLPDSLHAEGLVHVVAERQPDAEHYTVNADLGACLITAPYLIKEPGLPFLVHIGGRAGKGRWNLELLEFSTLEQRVRLRPGPQGLQTENLDLSLAHLAPLLKEPREVTGRLTGVLHTQPLQAAVRLWDFSAPVAQGIQIQSPEATVQFQGDQYNFSGVQLAGERTDITLDGSFGPEGWVSTVQGPAINLDLILDGLRELGGGEWARAGVERTALSVNTDRLHFRRASFHAVTGEVQRTREGLVVRELRCGSGNGTVTGTIRRATDAPHINLQLAFSNAELALFDQLLLAEPRYLEGSITGALDMHFTTGDDRVALQTLTGELQFDAFNGSYGHLGWATRLLSVLKNTELLRLRLPSSQDTGLSFRESSALLRFQDGVGEITRFALTDTAYTLEVQGNIDFPRDQLDAVGDVYLLESVTGPISNIPIVGNTIGLLKRVTSLGIIARGSPYNPSLRLEALSIPRRLFGGGGQRE